MNIKLHAIAPKTYFLLDTIGALISCMLLCFVLPLLDSGLERNTLWLLGGIAFGFALFSLFCFFKITSSWRRYLRIISLYNLTYCLLTGWIIVQNWAALRPFGIGYFSIEILFVSSLAMVELWRTKLPT